MSLRDTLTASEPLRPTKWRREIPGVVAAIIAADREMDPGVDAATIRQSVLDQFRAALDPEVDDDLFFAEEEDGREVISFGIAVRMVLRHARYDWSSPAAAESVMAVAQRTLDETLPA